MPVGSEDENHPPPSNVTVYGYAVRPRRVQAHIYVSLPRSSNLTRHAPHAGLGARAKTLAPLGPGRRPGGPRRRAARARRAGARVDIYLFAGEIIMNFYSFFRILQRPAVFGFGVLAPPAAAQARRVRRGPPRRRRQRHDVLAHVHAALHVLSFRLLYCNPSEIVVCNDRAGTKSRDGILWPRAPAASNASM